MMLNQKIGEVGFDNLVIRGGAAGHIRLAAEQGTLKKGSVIDEEGKLYAGGDAQPRFILCDETDTGDEAVTAAVWKSGCYVRGSLVVAEGYEFTDADTESLRDYGILVEDAR